MAMLRCAALPVSAVATPRDYQLSAAALTLKSSVHSRPFPGSSPWEEKSMSIKDVSRLSSMSTDCASSTRTNGLSLSTDLDDFSSDWDSVGDGPTNDQVVLSAAGVTLGSPRRQQFLYRAEQNGTRQFTISKAVDLKHADSESRTKTHSQLNRQRSLPFVSVSSLSEQPRVGNSLVSPKGSLESHCVTSGTSHVFVSEGCNLKMEQSIEARSRHVSWLRRALEQQISDYKNEWTVMERQQAKEQKEKRVLEQQRAEAEQKVLERVHMRHQRERQVQENSALLSARRHSKLEEMQQREIAREKRLAKEAWWQQQVAKDRKEATAARHEDVRREATRLAEEVKLARTAKMEVKQTRTEAVLSETSRIYELRKATNIVVEDCLTSMKNEILQQRLQSVFDLQALHEHMESLVESLPF